MAEETGTVIGHTHHHGAEPSTPLYRGVVTFKLRQLLTALVTVVLFFVLSACGSDAAETATDAAATDSTEDVDDTEAAESDENADADSDEADAATAEADTTTPEETSTAPDTNAINGGKPEVDPSGETPTELIITDLIEGTGKEAQPGDYLEMHYVGVRHEDGVQFDASWDRGSTFTFTIGIGQVISGWDQGIVGMKEGGRRELTIPSDMAYGERGAGADIPPGAALVFVVDLVQAATPPEVENAPEPVTELEVEILTAGTGATVGEGDTVQIHYQALLQPTGDVFDSSWDRGQPISLRVGLQPAETIPAWNEALVGRQVGDVVRMVIPPDMGIRDASGVIPDDATIVTYVTILGIG